MNKSMKNKPFWVVANHGPYMRVFRIVSKKSVTWDSIIAGLQLHGIQLDGVFVPYHAITGVFDSDPDADRQVPE